MKTANENERNPITISIVVMVWIVIYNKTQQLTSPQGDIVTLLSLEIITLQIV